MMILINVGAGVRTKGDPSCQAELYESETQIMSRRYTYPQRERLDNGFPLAIVGEASLLSS